MAYAIANVDYVILGLFQPGAVFAVYVLAFRLANAIPSQLSFVAARVLTVDLAADDPEGRQPVYEQYTRTLFLFGIVGAVATGLLAGVLPDVLGAEWRSITWVLAALACVVPWRMVLGVAGTLGVVAQRSRDLLSLGAGAPRAGGRRLQHRGRDRPAGLRRDGRRLGGAGQPRLSPPRGSHGRCPRGRRSCRWRPSPSSASSSPPRRSSDRQEPVRAALSAAPALLRVEALADVGPHGVAIRGAAAPRAMRSASDSPSVARTAHPPATSTRAGWSEITGVQPHAIASAMAIPNVSCQDSWT